jgi:hypothetical protein
MREKCISRTVAKPHNQQKAKYRDLGDQFFFFICLTLLRIGVSFAKNLEANKIILMCLEKCHPMTCLYRRRGEAGGGAWDDTDGKKNFTPAAIRSPDRPTRG